MMGKVDNEGKLDAIFIKKLNNYLSARVTSNFHSSNVEQGIFSLDLEYEDK